ncbi:hypothetical protein GPECTOR_2g1014 [Gonium pectorale]|uniref:Magnesium transporter n=1 Tax=Gonium pectorale TaxID=33097 RepID=A0A150H065_GONPE|nr:hypothetical protein GPECTOR_2g1014 [Gonium pectorale]|eukprot:KXZ55465.1 hypothetical protein GPECTOR_2g1014 [Gonium pectorale]
MAATGAQDEERASLLPHPMSLLLGDNGDDDDDRTAAPLHSSTAGTSTSVGVGGLPRLGSLQRKGGSGLAARAKWRKTTERIIQTNRVHGAITEALERHEPGAAPGIDPRRSIYQHLAAKWCLPATITVVDFDSKSLAVRSGLRGAEELMAVLSQPRGRSARVRWIHVDGLNWEVIQLLALTFDLHPLALEDTVHVPQRIKADFYDCCLYMALIYLYLAPESAGHGTGHGSDTVSAASAISAAQAGTRGGGGGGGGGGIPDIGLRSAAGSGGEGRPLLSATISSVERVRSQAACVPPGAAAGGGGRGGAAAAGAAAASSGGSPAGGAIHVSAQQVSLFLLRGEHTNTLITVFQSDGSAVTRPILAQLQEPRTLVREAEDASFLANLVIDTLVDHIFPVVGAYREQLQRYEADVMGGELPSAASTRELHAMQRDLRRIDRTIAPLQAVVSNMVTRDASTVDAAVAAGGRRLSDADGTPLTPRSATAHLALASAPFLSRLTRTYLGDVRDHVATICEDLISLSTECGDLVGLIFNLTTHRQSQSTQTLAVVSTIFLPITFLAGVYGMNFDVLPELHWSYGYAYFWVASIAIVVLFMGAMLRAGLWSR